MLRVHLMQNGFRLSDPGTEEALYEVASVRQFARLSLLGAIPDESTILHFRHLLEQHELAEQILQRVNAHLQRKGLLVKPGTMVDATIIEAPSSTEDASGERDPQMHQTKEGNDWPFGMKAHIGADVEAGLVHTVVTTAANESDVAQIDQLLHGKEEVVHSDPGYIGAPEHAPKAKVDWQIARNRGQVDRIANGKERAKAQRGERRKAQVRARVEHPFRVVKCQFGYLKVRFKGLMKNTAQVLTLFALANLYHARKRLLVA